MKRLYFFGFLWICSYGAQAQGRDSVRVDYSVEHADTAHRNIRETFRYVTRATVEEKTLIKAGAVVPLPLVGGYYATYGYGVGMGVEQKIAPAFSVQALVIGRYYRTGTIINTKVLEMPIAGRYYYSIKKRMRKGLSANNFSNDYVSIQLENILYGAGRYYSTSTSGNQTTILSERNVNRQFAMLSAVSLQWGIQRRLGSKGYIDFNLSFAALPVLTQQRVPDFVTPIKINFNLGLGW
ncbi:hypothetical protein ACS5NO_07745 [Larkinella sp. GY13]|uniref:hypothetical protein n=1 Tax=Larkinella sp. GY13 TaxID=3453720 RepID=UPI003EE8FBE8